MPILTVEHLAGFEHQLSLDVAQLAATTSIAERRLFTYLSTYPHLRAVVASWEQVEEANLTALISMVYGSMPTTMNLRRGDLRPLLPALNALRQEGQRLNDVDLIALKAVINNSIVGTSKALHFIAPEIYPVWDSRINRFLNGPSRPDTNDVQLYQAYLADFDRISAQSDFESLRGSVEKKLGYPVSAARAFELIMYMSDALKLQFHPAPLAPSTSPTPPEPTPSRPLVPRYKRDAFTFISSLSPITLDESVPDTLLRDGYLLSEHYTTSKTLALAATARRRRNLLISDNGNWTKMHALGRQFSVKGRALVERAEAELASGGLSQQIRNDRKKLMEEVASACTAALQEEDLSAIIETQLQMNPDYLIGMEDFTVPVLMMAGLMDPVFDPQPEEIAEFQQQTRDVFVRQAEGEFGHEAGLEETAMYLVVHGFDYASAYAAAAASRGINKDGVAISFGAPMESRRWVSEVTIGGVTEDFERKLPEKYIAATALTLGVVNGHADDVPVHVLGLGSPILIMLLGFFLKGSRAVCIDSTAPMLDAFDGRIYGTRVAFLKMRMYRLAAMCLIKGTPYESTTPFFQAFEARHPSDWEGLREALGVSETSEPKDVEKQLEAEPDLVRKHIPFFTRLTSSTDDFFWDLRVSRSGHNYFVLREIVDHVRRRRDDWSALQAWTEKEIARYMAAGSSSWAMAVQKSYELVKKHKLLPPARSPRSP